MSILRYWLVVCLCILARNASAAEPISCDPTAGYHPRLAAYRALMLYPAPWGLRCPGLAERIEQASADGVAIGQMNEAAGPAEPWLDLRSAAADACCRADYLLRLARLREVPGVDALKAAVEQAVEQLRLALAEERRADVPARLDQADKALGELDAGLAAKLDGVVRPESGTDIFTWLKAWVLVGMPKFPEYFEPTPYRADYSGVVLRLAEPDGKADLASTWTTNTYRGEGFTVRYSVLTPLATIDVQDGRFSMGIEGLAEPRLLIGGPAQEAQQWKPLAPGELPGVDVKMPAGWFALGGDKRTLLLVLNRRPTSARWTGQWLELAFEGPAAVGYVCTDTRSERDLSAMADFHQRVLMNQPVECVQVERGGQVEQTFEYVRRECDWPVQALTLAPVPHLATLSRKEGSALRVETDQPVQAAPDGWEYVPDATTLRYRMPQRPRNHTWGTNLYPLNSTKELYQEISRQGCRTVRLACGGLTDDWAPSSLDARKQMVRQNLQWAREAGGLKVGIDFHGWTPSQEYGSDKAVEDFVARWAEVISWCKDYDDVVAWYDLLNEPSIFHETQDVTPYADFMRKAVKALRPHAGDTPILVEAVNMANPVGLEFWEDLGDAKTIVGFHDYWPHQFTHQWVVDKGNSDMPRVFFPSFMPMIEWSSPSWRNDQPHFHYWDRWKCDAISLPVFRLMIEKSLRMDCGEYGVVGYAGQASVRSGVLWMRQALERFRRMGINHNVWSVSDLSGFTWLVPEYRDETLRFWRDSAAGGAARNP